MTSFPRFGIKALFIMAVLAWMAPAAGHWALWQGGLTIMIVAVPAWVTLAYLSALRSAHARAILLRPVWWSMVLSGHVLRLVLAVPVALLAGAGVMSALLGAGQHALLWIAAAAVLVFVLTLGLDRVVRADLRPYARLRPTLYGACLVTAAILVGCHAALTAWPVPGDLREAIQTQPRHAGSSALIGQWTDAMAIWSGGMAWAEGQAAAGLPYLAIFAWRLASGFGYFAGVALAFAACLIPPHELRRILQPTDADDPLPVGPGRAALAGALSIIVLLSAVQSLARLEEASLPRPLLPGPAVQTELPDMALGSPPAPQQPGLPAPDSVPSTMVGRLPLPVDLRRTVEVDQIGDLTCPRGTIAHIAALDADLAAVIARQKADVAVAVVAGFDGMRANVPAFLDWYYSLSAEYLRTLNILAGNGATYLNTQLQGHLGAGDPLAGLHRAVEALGAGAVLADVHQQNRIALLSGCTNLPSDLAAPVAVNARLAAFQTIALHEDATAFESRLATAGLTGGIGAGVAGVVVGKVIAKVSLGSAFKVAATALAKMAGSKAMTVAGGVLIGGGGGAAGGSVVPGIGTVAGAVIGGIMGGAAVWIGVDYTMLRLEEEISRDAFEADILAAISATEAEIMAALDYQPQGQPIQP